MKKIIYTQRTEVIDSYGEVRDCADRKLAEFIWRCGYLPVPLPNVPDLAEKYVQELRPDGIILTGGNSLVKYGGNAPERDMTEKLLIEWAVRQDIPLLGFCRGMQMIADYFAEPLEDIENHVRTRHEIIWQGKKRSVNSYHNQGLRNCSDTFVKAWSDDGIVEAIEHKSFRIMGIMWHPEREKVFDELDVEMVKEFFIRGVNS